MANMEGSVVKTKIIEGTVVKNNYVEGEVKLGSSGSGGFNKLDKKYRSQVTDIYSYTWEDNSVPYLYGVYGDKNNNYAETQGLIEGSTGKICNNLADEVQSTDAEAAEMIRKGVIPSGYRHLLDPHTIVIRDGNCAVPCGKHVYDVDEDGNIINSVLYYGAAVPTGYMRAYVKEQIDKIEIPEVPEVQSNNSNIVNGTNYGLYQESEKDDKAVTLKFTDLKVGDKTGIAGTYDRTSTGKTGVALGSSVAIGDRSFSAGSSNVAAGGKSMALGCDNYCGGNQSIALGYANYSTGSSSVALGHRNNSTGVASLAAGTECESSGDAAVAMGTGSIAAGRYSTACGNQSRAGYDNQFVVGKFNLNANDTFFEVGNGTKEDDRHTAFAVCTNGDIRIGQTQLSEQHFIALFETVGEMYESLDGLETLLGGI